MRRAFSTAQIPHRVRQFKIAEMISASIRPVLKFNPDRQIPIYLTLRLFLLYLNVLISLLLDPHSYKH
jgi:hypothetical protein